MVDARTKAFPVGAKVTSEALALDPYPVLARLRDAEPVSWLPDLGAWFITRRDLALEVMRDADAFTVDDPRFTTQLVLGPSMLSLDGPEHTRHRSPFAPAFQPGVLRDHFDEFLADEVQRLIAAFDAPTTAELRTELAGPLAVHTITKFLGLDGVSSDEVLEWYQSISKAITDLTRGLDFASADQAAVANIRARVQQTLDSETDDTLLKSIERSGALRPEEMGSAALVLMFGAIETSEGMTANALWHLLSNDDAWETVRREPALIAAAIEESLRLEPAASWIDRYTTRDVVVADVHIPKGELVTVNLLAANRDDAVFPNPDRFDLHRSNSRQHLTFVQGPHGCLGLHLARMETAAAIKGMLVAHPDLTLEADRSTPPSGLIFRKSEAVWANW